MKFKYSRTVLNVTVVIGVLVNIVFTIFNWKQLSAEEGWGILAVLALGVFTLSGLVIDFILQLIFKDKKTLNVIGSVVVMAYLFILFYLS